jgi:hypothetical protein
MYEPIPNALEPDGHTVRWATWDHQFLDTTTIRWENEGFTVGGVVTRERIEYVLRLSASWQVRQFILFRDLDEPDLWLATDGSGRWGEMNGAHRTELDGCYDIHLACAPFTHSLPVRRLPLLPGHTAELPVVQIDTDTLEVRAVSHRYTRLDEHTWQHTMEPAEGSIGAVPAEGSIGAVPAEGSTGAMATVEFTVDQHGLVIDYPDAFRRVS